MIHLAMFCFCYELPSSGFKEILKGSPFNLGLGRDFPAVGRCIRSYHRLIARGAISEKLSGSKYKPVPGHPTSSILGLPVENLARAEWPVKLRYLRSNVTSLSIR